MKSTALAVTVLTALLAATPVLAQSGTSTGTMDKMPAGAMMKAAPTFHYSTESNMNMMMTKGAIAITPVPGEKLLSRRAAGQGATLVYAGTHSGEIFNFYDQAIKAEGWKTTMMNGKMVDTRMAGGAMTQAKPNDKMAGTMMAGTHSATFTMGSHTVDLRVSASSGRVTVSFKSK